MKTRVVVTMRVEGAGSFGYYGTVSKHTAAEIKRLMARVQQLTKGRK